MNKPKKGKIIMIISISLVAFILSMVMFTQFKTVRETDITGIETMRETELKTELASWKNKYDDVVEKTEETQSKIDEYKNQISSNKDLTELLTNELDEAEMYAGYTDLEGEGITITLTDTDEGQVKASDLITLINELKNAGAEAISINGERIVSTTDIVDISYSHIVINTNFSESEGTIVSKISSPYTIKAIGNQKYLESAITIKYGFKDSIEANGVKLDYSTSDNVLVEKYNGDLSYKYSTDVK